MFKKSQSSIEFIILVSVMLLFFTIFFTFIYENISDKIQENQNEELKNIAINIQKEINFAFESQDGYFREFSVPDSIGQEDYTLEVIENKIYIKSEKNAIALPIKSITGQIQKGNNIIKKQNSIIYLN